MIYYLCHPNNRLSLGYQKTTEESTVLKFIKALFYGLTWGFVGGVILLIIAGGIKIETGYQTSPSILYFGILVVGAFILARPRSREVLVRLISSLAPAIYIALGAETCQFGKECLELYTTKQNLTYSITHLLMGLVVGLGLRLWGNYYQEPKLIKLSE